METIIETILEYGKYAIYGIVTLIVLRLIIKKKQPEYHSHWATLLETRISAMDFYQTLKAKLIEAEVHGIKFGKKNLSEANLSLNKRRYLKIEFKDYSFLISSAPFGKKYTYISYWGHFNRSIWQEVVERIPFIGEFLAKKLFSMTYYKHDICSSFLTLLHEKVQEVVKEHTDVKGMQITNMDKPILNDFFKR